MADENLNQSTGQSGTNLQQPREDLQTSGGAEQAPKTMTQSPESLSQDKLSTDKLRVGTTEVANDTSIPRQIGPDYWNAAWLWMLVPVLLAVVLFWPQKKKKPARATSAPAADVPVLDMAALERAAKKKKSKKRR